MNDPKELGYAIAYMGGLAALAVAAWPLDNLSVPLALAAGWSLLFGLMTTRFDALLLPVSALGGATMLFLLTADLQGWGSDTGPISLLLIPVFAGYLLLPLALPMGAGILLARLWRRAAKGGTRHSGARGR
jgi:hypothetical protein